MSQPNRKYKRLEALFSEAKQVDPDPVSLPVQGEMDAMKTRVRELEAQLEQRAGIADKKIPVFVQETDTQSLSSTKEKPDRAPGIRAYISFLIAKLFSLGDFIVRPFRDYPLRKRLITSFLLLTIVPLIILGWRTYTTTHDIVEEQIKEGILRSSLSMSAAVQEFLSSQFSLIRSEARATEINEYMSLHQARRKGSAEESLVYEKLETFRKNNPTYIKSYALLDNNGIDILDTNQTRIGTSFAEQEFFTTVMASRNHYVSGLTLTPNGDRIIYFATPVISKSGEVLGVYVVTYNADIIQSIFNQILGDNQAAAPTTEYTYVIEGNNYFLLAHTTRVNLVYKSYLEMDDPRLEKFQEAGAITHDKLNTLVIPGSEIVTELSKMENTINFQAPSHDGELTESAAVRLSNSKWIVVTSQPVSTISNIIQNQTRTNVIVSVIIMAFASLIALVASSFFTNPIIQLTRVAENISSGDLTQKADIRRNDEIGVLARTFNAMTDQLQASISGLEQRVEDRTHDLELASEVGRTIAEKVEDVSAMLTQATEMIRSRFNLYYTQVYLVDPSGRTITLRAGTGNVGQQLLRRGHYLLVNSGSLNGRSVSEKKSIIVTDTSKNPSFLPNPLLPNTQSEMVVPLIVSGRVLGVLDLQSEFPDALNHSNLPAFETLAGQLSIAIQNATLFAQSEETRKHAEANVRQITETGWNDFLNAIERGEKIGYTFNQIDVIPMENVNGMTSMNALKVPIKVVGTNVGTIQLVDEVRKWTTHETEIVQAAAEQLAQHIDNLRLLAQAETYRSKAELAVRRLTREGWETFLQTSGNLASGYSYDLNEIKPLDKAVESDAFFSQSRPITVRDETIGELMINTDNFDLEGADEIFAAVTAQLGDHIENLRLIEETQQRTVDLEESQTFLDSVVENLPTMLFVKDAEELRFVRWNKAAEELTGFGRETLINKNDYDFFPKEQADSFTSDDRQVLVSGQTLDVPEESLATVHQGTRYMHTRKVPIYGKDGKAKYLLGVSEDVTERKHDQEILAQRANQLETVATLSSTASTVLDPDKLLQAVVDLTKERFNMYHTHIYLADESWNTLLLAAGAGAVGRQMVETGHAIKMDAEKSLVARASRERKAIIVNDVRSEADFLPNPMLPETRAEIAVPLIVGDKVLGVFDVQSNIAGRFTQEDASIFTTLASQVAVALQNARLYVEQSATVTQLRELDRLKSSFLANMSHELRTPLNSILGFADVMLEELDGPLTENMNTDLGLIQKNGQHLLHLINDVLDMAKIESGTMNLTIEKFILHDVIDEVTSITSPLASEKNLALFIEPDSDHEVEINADKIRLRQVMINIVNNAMKFTEKGKISIRAQREDNHIVITVKDTGIGIPPEHLESVFQEFTQVDSTTTRKAGGTGLGLPISRRLIQMHSGRLWAESSGVDGAGATFYVQLPIESNINEAVTLMAK